MSTQVIVYILTALGAVVVVLTRVRLRSEGGGAGQFRVGGGLLNLHTIAGTLALVTWVTFLVAPEDSALGGAGFGVLSLGFWWIVALAGLAILLRWAPTKGKHATSTREDSWSEGPALSILAHVGMLVGTCVFTGAYLVAAV
ncbi:hypothetical protein [Nocardioides pacificus]